MASVNSSLATLLTSHIADLSLLLHPQQANDEFFLATDSSMADTTGSYFVHSRKSSMRRPAQNAEQRRRLWDTLVEQTGAQWQF